MYWNRIIILLLKVLRNLFHEAYWICYLLIFRDLNKEKFVHRYFLCLTKLRRKRSVMRLASHLGARSLGGVPSPWFLALLDVELAVNWRNMKDLFQVGNIEQSRDLNNPWKNKACNFVITICYYYQWRCPNTEEKRWLKIQMVQMKAT